MEWFKPLAPRYPGGPRRVLRRPAVRLQRLAEGLEQRAVDRIALRIVLGMPLHAERKPRCVRNPDRIDGASFPHALDDDTLAGIEDALPVQRVDANGFAAEQFCKGAVG